MSEPIPQPGVQFSVNDRGGEYYTKLQQLAAAVDLSITAYNAAVAAGTDASGYLQQIQELQVQINNAMAAAIEEVSQIRDNTQAIAEGELPVQTGQQNKALITNGANIGWHHLSGFNRSASASITLIAGDKVMMTATEELVVSLPAAIAVRDPFLIRNSSESTADVVLQMAYAVVTPPGYPDIAAGDTVRLAPGEKWELSALSNSKLELLV